jgi:hypothetical protein
MFSLKKSIYKTRRIEEVVQLDPFDYMIITYIYDPPAQGSGDLDSATRFANTGSIEDSKWVGCGFGYRTPLGSTPINSSYLYQPGDDSQDGTGESIVVNFKNIEDAGILTNQDITVELYAGWCNPNENRTTNISITTYEGGTLSLNGLVVLSDGVIKDQFIQNNLPVRYSSTFPRSCCDYDYDSNDIQSMDAMKTHVATVNYNTITKVASVTFY